MHEKYVSNITIKFKRNAANPSSTFRETMMRLHCNPAAYAYGVLLPRVLYIFYTQIDHKNSFKFHLYA